MWSQKIVFSMAAGFSKYNRGVAVAGKQTKQGETIQMCEFMLERTQAPPWRGAIKELGERIFTVIDGWNFNSSIVNNTIKPSTHQNSKI